MAMRNPAGMEERVVQNRGEISWRGYEVTVGLGLAKESVGVSEKDGRVAVWYGTRRLRVLDAAALRKGRFN